jgi:hypothetical protein
MGRVKMADTIEGIPEERLDRLKMHLLKVERMVGKPLNERARGLFSDCPIFNFAPLFDKNGKVALAIDRNGTLYYGNPLLPEVDRLLWQLMGEKPKTRYQIYSHSDNEWWKGLNRDIRRKITKYIQGWIKDRNG